MASNALKTAVAAARRRDLDSALGAIPEAPAGEMTLAERAGLNLVRQQRLCAALRIQLKLLGEQVDQVVATAIALRLCAIRQRYRAAGARAAARV